MHTLQLKLDTTKYDDYLINRRFNAIFHIHNVCVKHMKRCLRKLSFDTTYQLYLDEYRKLIDKSKDKRLSAVDRKRRDDLSNLMKDIRLSYGLSECQLRKYIKKCKKRYKHLVTSQQVQKEVIRVWKGVEKVLFGKGKDIHYKRFFDFDTIGQTSNINGIKFDKDSLSFTWTGQTVFCKHRDEIRHSWYAMESLNHEISYCEIKRRMFNTGWHYYLIIYLDGEAPKKLCNIGSDTMGIDLGFNSSWCF